MAEAKTYFDAGTYVGNGGQLRIGMPTKRTFVSTQVSKSIRFRTNGPTYFQRSFGNPTSSNKWTFSAWVKLGNLGSTTGRLLTANINGDEAIRLNAGNLQIYFNAATSGNLVSQATFRDPNVWYHIVVAVDTSQATASNRVIAYVNNRQITSFSTAIYPAQNYNTSINSFSGVTGLSAFPSNESFDGYISEFYFIDGLQLTPSSFGTTNSDGIWIPTSYTGAYGLNGSYLNFSNSSNTTSFTLGKDYSGNGNDWGPFNFSVTAGITNDSLTDTPTDYGTDTGLGGEVRGNYVTLNSLNFANGFVTLSNANMRLTLNSDGLNHTVGSTTSLNSGRWYFETTITTVGGSSPYVGIIPITSVVNSGSNLSVASFTNSCWAGNGAFSAGDIIGFAFNLDSLTFAAYRNGVQLSGGNISGSTITSGIRYMPAFSGINATVMDVNFGQRPFAYTPPANHRALCSTNIADISDSSKWFYGNSPDFIWIKNRTNATSHTLSDIGRGFELGLSTDNTLADYSKSQITEINKFGMSVSAITDGNTNTASSNFIYFAWDGGGIPVTNSTGLISCEVSANTTSGFSVVTYTGNGSGVSTSIAHGLGATPSMYIIKNRSAAGTNWVVYHQDIGNNVLFLNTTAISTANSAYFSSFPNSSFFYVSTDSSVNTNGSRYVAFVWTPIEGYSSFGSYTGNGATDGPFIYTGFRPRWIMIKRSSVAVGNWRTYDTTRSTINPMGSEVYPNSPIAETSNIYFDITANGFKLRTTDADLNTASSSYIYAAFAENPFKFSRAR